MNKLLNKANTLGMIVSGDGLLYKRRPDLIVGDEKHGYMKGDLLDANAVSELIDNAVNESEDRHQEIENVVDEKISALIDGAPETLNTLKELSNAIVENEGLIDDIQTVVNQTMKYQILKPGESIHNTELQWGNVYDLGTVTSPCIVSLPRPDNSGTKNQMFELVFKTGNEDISIGYAVPGGGVDGVSEDLQNNFKANTSYKVRIYGYSTTTDQGVTRIYYHYYSEVDDNYDNATQTWVTQQGYLTSYTETDPTVPAWAKQSTKPTYTASEIGAVPTIRTVNGKALSSDITITAADVNALPSNTVIPDVTGKEDKINVVAASGTTLSAAINNYYKFSSAVGTLTVTLPTPAASGYLSNIIFSFTTSASPNVTFTASQATIQYADGFEIEASTKYEINALWDGTMWILGMMRIEV